MREILKGDRFQLPGLDRQKLVRRHDRQRAIAALDDVLRGAQCFVRARHADVANGAVLAAAIVGLAKGFQRIFVLPALE